MTLADVKNMSCDTITPEIVGKVLKCNPHNIRIAARENMDGLGFPVIVLGSRTIIPRIAFINYMEGVMNNE